MTKKSPKVSIIMSVHSALIEELSLSVNSIINQNFYDYEFIIVDDINDISISKYLLSLAQKFSKIKVINNNINQGLTKSLILAINMASGIYIARQDADDFSNTSRILEQVEYLDKNKDIILLGTGYTVIHKNLGLVEEYFPFFHHDDLLKQMFKINPFCHSSVMFRKKAYYQAGGYNPDFITSQDFDLWFRLLDYGKFSSLGENLVTRNITDRSLSSNLGKALQQVKNGLFVRLRERKRLTNRYTSLKIIFIFYTFLRCLVILFIPNKIIVLKKRCFKN